MDFYKNYDISKDYGFLLEEPYQELPKKFKFLQKVIENLNSDTESFLEAINNLEEFDKKYFQQLVTKDGKILYSIYSIICHKYIWCENKPKNIIPRKLGYPWYIAAKSLGLKPVLTHAALNLYNWSLLDNNLPFCLDNIKSNFTITGSMSEEWFYLIVVACEGVGAKIIFDLFHFNNYNKNKFLTFLDLLEQVIHEINIITSRMYERCDYKDFFYGFRKYLQGFNDVNNFPNGLEIENFKTKENINYLGGSAAQSTLIQALDICLGIEHKDEHSKHYLKLIRDYMPYKHKLFLEDIERHASIKEYINKNFNEDMNIINRYNECLRIMTKFRETHLKLIHNYVVRFSRNNNITGTGGTNVDGFVKNLIQDTKETGINNKKNIIKEEYNLYILAYIVLFISLIYYNYYNFFN